MSDHQSPTIGKLAEAQFAGNAEAESLAILAIANRKRPCRRRPSLGLAFFERLAYGMSDCWYWVGTRGRNPNGTLGYGVFPSAHKVYGCPEIMAHRISWHLHYGPIPDGVNVLHRCDVQACGNPSHLFLGTQADNVADMVSKGRNRSPGLRGEANPMSRLTADLVRQIRTEHASGQSQRSIAKKHGVSPMTISRAVRNETWRTT